MTDSPPQVLASLGVRRDPLAGQFQPPDEATIRRVLEAMDAATLDAAVGSWLDARLRAAAWREMAHRHRLHGHQPGRPPRRPRPSSLNGSAATGGPGCCTNIRDVSYGEGASQIRTSNGPQVMAALCNLAIAILKLTGARDIAADCRHHARDASRTLATLGLSLPRPKRTYRHYAVALATSALSRSRSACPREP